MAYCTTAELAGALRIRETVENAATLQACVDAAAEEIDGALDRFTNDPLVPSLTPPVWTFVPSPMMAFPTAGQYVFNDVPGDPHFVYFARIDGYGIDRTNALLALPVGSVLTFTVPGADTPWGTYVTSAIANPSNDPGSIAFDLVSPPAPPGFVGPAPAEGAGSIVGGIVDTTAVAAPALVNRDNVYRAVQWYKANDVAVGGGGYADTGLLNAPSQPFKPMSVVPYKQQWGVA